jgi:hypothetical protein
MPTNLTATKINATFGQLLHIDGGPDATEKPVYSGNGVSTALRLGIDSLSVGNIRLQGGQISATAGTVQINDIAVTSGSISGITDLAIADGGTGASDASTARTNLGLGTIATQAANNVAITGGSITGVTIPFNSVSERKYGMFSDIQDQTGSTTAGTAVLFRTNEITGAGISVVSSSRITFDTAGTYMIAPNLQFNNTDTADQTVTIWFKLNGVNIDRSATKISVPKATDGGTTFFQITFYEAVSASQYIEVFWLPASTTVTIDHTAAGAIAPAIPSALVVAQRIA